MSKCIYDTTRECPTITNENGYTYPKYKDCVDCFKTRCIEIPEKATNGDMIKVMFPNVTFVVDEEIDEQGVKNSYVWAEEIDGFLVDLDWWNAPYVIPNSKN